MLIAALALALGMVQWDWCAFEPEGSGAHYWMNPPDPAWSADDQEFVATCQLGRCVAITPAATPPGAAQARQEQEATPEYRSPFAEEDAPER